MVTEKRKAYLHSLAEKLMIAGDPYYCEMNEDDFAKATSSYQDDEGYRYYLQQRDLGFEKYQEVVLEEVAEVSSSEEIHLIAKSYNYDNGAFFPLVIIFHPFCDIETAKMVYWLLVPTGIYERYGSLAACSEDDFSYETARVLLEIEHKAKKDGFLRTLSVDRDENAYEVFEEISDFNKVPYIAIPEVLRYSD